MALRVLIIGYVWPEPRSSAAGSRMMDIIRMLKQHQFQILFASQAKDTAQMVDLNALDIERARIEVNNDCFDDLLDDYQPHIVIFDRYLMEEQFGWRVKQHCPNALLILETSDLHSLREARQYAYKQRRAIKQSDYHRSTALREIASIYRCDMSLIISEAEMNHLQQVYGIDAALLYYLPLMVDSTDLEQQQSSAPGFEQRQGFLFIGNFRHSPNWDAVQFLYSLWPALRQQYPGARIYVYGAYMPDQARQLHQPQRGFYIEGWVNEVAHVMQQRRINLAPLRFGAGMKGKLIDAMLHGTPSVCTPVAAEGIDAGLPWPGVIAEDTDDLIGAAVALYHDSHQWQQAADNGFELLRQRHLYQAHNQAFHQAIAALRENLEQHRLGNFTGAMLGHHRLNSTRYLSKWITEKNKHHS